MAAPDRANLASNTRPAAVMIGGQRRRIARRSNMPRSNTMPVLGPESTTTVNSAGGNGAATAESSTRPEPSNVTASAVPSNPMMDSSNPTTDSYPKAHITVQPRSYADSLHPDVLSSMPAAYSPMLTTEGASTTSTESKKKHGLFSFKSRDHYDRSSSSSGSQPQQSPLPPLTPVKAAQVLGVEASTGRIRSNSAGRQQQDGGYDVLPVQPLLTKQASTPMLTNFKDVMSRQSKFKEEGVEPDPPKSKGFWGNSKKGAARMLDFLPSRGSSSKRADHLQRAAADSLDRLSEEDTESNYSSEPDLHARPRLLPVAARPIAEAPSRRVRKKAPKSVDRMAPITETSHDELRSSYHSSEHNTELDLISEYEQEHPLYSAPLPRSHTESTLTTDIRSELEAEHLSPTGRPVVEEAVAQEAEHTTHSGKDVHLNKGKGKQPAAVHLRGPLQTEEHRILDALERNLEAYKAKLDSNDAARKLMDAEVAATKLSHEKMKKEFAATTRGFSLNEAPCVHEAEGNETEDNEAEDSEDDQDLISIRSSIDLDEEPTVHVATAMTFTRVTPGMVKLVDIPPRKKKPVAPVGSVAPVAPVAPKPNLPSSSQVKPSSKPTYYFEHDEEISPSNQRSDNAEPTGMRDHLDAQSYNRITKDKKAKMPRNESQLLVQDWISTYDHAKQRPVSERIDVDVLADQQIPPAPFPKEDRPTPPPKSSARQHYCLKNGHIFHPIDLKTVPDEVGINSLEVRPYLHSPSGIKQHVHIPVFCDRCNDDVKEELWECDIAVCRMGVCKPCAEHMELEWQERVART
ncbi:hypothetical protein BDW02DRAFT_596588 [Decorospora gaudefroyi]|uniref:Uncharacterized protein n=1 Tax=Decorospora gaudefroyi TaxID=184978 RepID=A0A6A5KP93_9PLEO|nr:hypothetical protein BDW02DRAFT_596588 [Decorospora gaudefroyi]